MSMDSARTAWAEDLGLTEVEVEELTLVIEESWRREREDGARRAELPPGDVDAWPLVLEEVGHADLARRVQEIREETP